MSRPPLTLQSILQLIIILVLLLKGPMCSNIIVCLRNNMRSIMQPMSLLLYVDEHINDRLGVLIKYLVNVGIQIYSTLSSHRDCVSICVSPCKGTLMSHAVWVNFLDWCSVS